MNNSAAKVGEIFTEAGLAFNKLAEMTMMLHPIAEQLPSTQSKPVKRKVLEERVVQSVSNLVTQAPAPQNIHTPLSQQVTLNMLNAPESEIDVETSLSNDVKLEFESSTEESAT